MRINTGCFSLLLVLASMSELSAQLPSTPQDSLQLTWARQYGSAAAPSYDRINDCTVDDLGNVYVAGLSDQLPYGRDFVIIKYSQTGNTIWTARYDCGTFGYDEAEAITVDASHNVYVTGSSTLFSGGSDIATVKYSPEGTQLWVSRYSSPMRQYDRPLDIAVDSGGNVYVTGENRITSNTSRYVTLKYNNEGSLQWVNVYPDSPASYNTASSIAVDGGGNVYLTGTSALSPGRPEFATIKYDRTGNTLWVARLAGYANSPAYASSLTLDDSSNAYVTGYSYGQGTSSDFTTVRYSADGIELWVARYDGGLNNSDEGEAIAVDRTGNVYVTGQSISVSPVSYDIAIIKYSHLGIQQWVARYAGPGNSYDSPRGIGIDASGCVYVGGTSIGAGTSYDFVTMKYDTQGVQQWLARFDGATHGRDEVTAFALDALGNVIVAGMTTGPFVNYDCLTVKYSSTGVQEWVCVYDGPGSSSESPRCMLRDTADNVYVGGGSYGGGTGRDWVLMKYDRFGNQHWVARLNSEHNGQDYLGAMALDRTGSIYLTGQSLDTLSQSSIITARYDAAGILQWSMKYPGPQSVSAQGSAISLDRTGDVYVASCNSVAGTGNDYVTLKYAPNGTLIWSARYNGPSGGSDVPVAVAVDDSENVLITGSSSGIATVKYNSAGIQQWVARYTGPAYMQSYPNSLELDSAGNVFVSGTATSYLDTTSSFVTIKYNRAGVQQWAQLYKVSPTSENTARAMRVAPSGNVYVAGTSQIRGGASEFATAKYSTDGHLVWVTRYSAPTATWSAAAALALDRSENIFVTGRSQGCCTTVMYDSSGNRLSDNRYCVPSSYWADAHAIVAGQRGEVFVLGSATGAGWTIFTLLLYERTPLAVNEDNVCSPTGYTLSQSYPNPFNPVAAIRFDLPEETHVSLKIYDLLGQEIMTLVDELKQAGRYEVRWNAADFSSGVYFYRLKAGGFVQTMKFILLK
jgi:uncharacterized delta-60 repeat protein